MKKYVIILFAVLSGAAFSDGIQNPNIPITPGTGIQQTGTSFNVKYGTIAGTAVQGNAVIDVAHGGTGATSIPANSVIVGNGTGTIQSITPGASGTVLVSNGPGSAPSFQGNQVFSVFGQSGAVPNLSGDVTTSGSSVVSLSNTALARGNIGLGATASPTFGGLNINGSAVVTGAINTAGNFTAPYIQTKTLMNGAYPQLASYGSVWSSQNHPNWNVVQTSKLWNPTEWQIYSNSAQGIAQVIAGTNQVVRVSGTSFNSAWVGQPYFYWGGQGFKVASVTDANHLTVTTTSGGAVSWGVTANDTFHYVVTSVDSVVNVNGTAVTWVSGDYFIPFYDSILVNGTQYTGTFNSPTYFTIGTNLGTLTGASFKQYKSIANELSNLRLQGLAGADEEDFVITQTPAGTTMISSYAGAGKYRPIWMGTGENPIGSINYQIGMHPASTLGNPGWVTIGGDNGYQAALFNQDAQNVNYFLVQGGRTGISASLAVRGTDANPGLNFDLQGAGTYNFTSHNFGNSEFKIFGNGGSSYLGVGSSTVDTPIIGALGTSPNISIDVEPKGTGVFQVKGQPVFPNFSGVTNSFGGNALLAGQCTTGGVTLAGATTGMAVVATPQTWPGDNYYWNAYVNSPNNISVKLCAVTAGTPPTTIFNVRVIQ